jgi:hypothetical protein
MQGVERVPDAIEPLIGYRAWYFSVVGRASLFPISAGDPAAMSAWEGANRGWVSATCPFESPHQPHDPPRTRLQAIRPAVGFRPELCVACAHHTIPGEGCSCGFYAMKALVTVEEPPVDGVILGRVELAGKVIEYTSGYRAERARIVELTPVVGTEPDAMRLADRLGLPMTAPLAPWSVRRRHISRD